jgi:hypothetical protein
MPANAIESRRMLQVRENLANERENHQALVYQPDEWESAVRPTAAMGKCDPPPARTKMNYEVVTAGLAASVATFTVNSAPTPRQAAIDHNPAT